MSGTIKQLRVKVGNYPRSKNIMAEEKNIMTGGGELVTNCDRFKNLKHSTVCPFAFTEQGVAMFASVLRSETAIRVSIRIMNAFVSMRHFLINNDRTKILRQKCSMALSASQRLRGSWLCLHAQCRAEKHYQSCR